jgi:HJR/Mrr/RecB family endonuclease
VAEGSEREYRRAPRRTADPTARLHQFKRLRVRYERRADIRHTGGRPLGSPAIQTLNGTARPVYKADIVIAVTNASFTSPAHDLAAKQDIHLLFGPRLRKWATWGVPLLTALGNETEATPEAA